MYEWRTMTVKERSEAIERRQGQRVPWHGPPHWGGEDGGAFHMSAACYEHRSWIGRSPTRLSEFESALLETLHASCEEVAAWCVLPNHYHALVLTENLKALVAALGQLHGRTSYAWNTEEGARGRKVWYRCSDRSIQSERHYYAALNYVHNQPMHHGCAKRWSEWPWSSAIQWIEWVGRGEAERVWRDYPVLDFGKGWDEGIVEW
jgi:putative transposase